MDIIVFLKSVIVDIEKSMNEIDENIISKISDNQSKKYKALVSQNVDVDRIETFVKKTKKEFKIINEMLENYETKYFNEWEKYNINYQVYLQIIIRDLQETFNKIKIRDVITNNDFWIWEEHINRIEKLNKNCDIMLPFSSVLANKYILFGKNGTGKTKLLNLIKTRVFGNAYYIPASRNGFEDKKLSLLNCEETNKLCWNFETLLQLFIKLIFKELQYEEYSHVLQDGKRIANSYELFLQMYEKLELSRKIKINFEKNSIELYEDSQNIPTYDIKDASDGEKSIIQFLLYIFLIPKKSYIIIDEPELHINSSILKKVFNYIEEFRQDLVFIYSSHSIEFIESREKAKLINIKDYNGKTWDYEYLENSKLTVEQILEIIGSKKPIIYIEGTENSIDYEIYSKIFKEFKVIPLNSCAEIIKVCKSIKKSNINYNGEIYGIIDNDFRDTNVIEDYKKSNIYTLPCSEVENVLFHPLIIEYILKKYQFTHNNKIEKLKEEIINKMKSNNKQIINDFINKKSEMFNNKKKHRYIDKESLKTDIEENFHTVLNRFLVEFDKFEVKLRIDLYSNVYENIYVYPNKDICSALKKISLSFEDYLNWIKVSLEEDEDFRKNVITEIFDSFMYDKRRKKLTPKTNQNRFIKD